MDSTAPKRVIALWSAPRSRSTAFLRMMMERDDLVALHEPFSQLKDFGVCSVGGREVRDEAELISAIGALEPDRRVFFKDTTDFHYPGVLADREFLRGVEHTFIIRHPREVIPSHYALNPALTLPEVGFARLRELYDAVADATGAEPVVVDSDRLIDEPEKTVRAYAERVRLPFHSDALTWKAGMPQEWTRTARWHTDAGNSSGFTRSERTYPATVENTPVLAEYFRHELPHYDYLRDRSLPV